MGPRPSGRGSLAAGGGAALRGGGGGARPRPGGPRGPEAGPPLREGPRPARGAGPSCLIVRVKRDALKQKARLERCELCGLTAFCEPLN